MKRYKAVIYQALLLGPMGCNAFISFAHQCKRLPIKKNNKVALTASENDDREGATNRRDAIQIGALALSSLFVSANFPTSSYAAGDPRTIVLTGGNSGLGFEAVKILASSGHTIVLPCRTMQKSEEAIGRLTAESTIGGNIIAAECDLANLRSIQNFAKDLPSMLGGKKIDFLGLNAGIARDTNSVDCARTKDGFELTVGTNHFGHFALNKLLLPSVEPNGGRIVVVCHAKKTFC